MKFYISFILLIMMVVIIPHNVLATFSGNDDGFHTTGTLVATDNTCNVQVDVTFHDYLSTGTGGAIGSFDDEDDTGTVRTPLRIRVVRTIDATCLGSSNSARVRVYTDQTCSGSTIIDQSYSTAGTSNINQNTGFDGNIGELCVRLDATADDNILDPVSSNDASGNIGIAPYLTSQSVSESSINLGQTQTVTHNIESGEDQDISNIRIRLARSSDDTFIKSQLTDTSPQNSQIEQMIEFNPNPSYGTNHIYIYTSWVDNSASHSRFSTNSLNSDSSGLNPKTSNFIISDTITCEDFTNPSGFSIYNRGETLTNHGGTIDDSEGADYNIDSGVTSQIHYRVTGSGDNEFSSSTFDVNNTGAWSRTTLIPTTVSAAATVSGTNYDTVFRISTDSDSSEFMECKYSTPFSISKLYQVDTSFSLPSYYATDFFSIQTEVTNARGDIVEGAKFNLSVKDNTGTIRYTTDSTTGEDGSNITDSYMAIRPLGAWTAESILYINDNDGNEGEDDASTLVILPGQDPLVADADGAYIVGETNNWISVKAITPSGARVFNDNPCNSGETCIRDGDMKVYVYFPNGTVMTEGTGVFYNPTDWRYNMTLPIGSPIGTYAVYANATVYDGSDSGDILNGVWATNAVFQVWDSRGGGGGSGFNEEQNATLYYILDEVRSLRENNTAEHQLTRSTITEDIQEVMDKLNEILNNPLFNQLKYIIKT